MIEGDSIEHGKSLSLPTDSKEAAIQRMAGAMRAHWLDHVDQYNPYGFSAAFALCARIAIEQGVVPSHQKLYRRLRGTVRGKLDLCQLSAELLDDWCESPEVAIPWDAVCAGEKMREGDKAASHPIPGAGEDVAKASANYATRGSTQPAEPPRPSNPGIWFDYNRGYKDGQRAERARAVVHLQHLVDWLAVDIHRCPQCDAARAYLAEHAGSVEVEKQPNPYVDPISENGVILLDHHRAQVQQARRDAFEECDKWLEGAMKETMNPHMASAYHNALLYIRERAGSGEGEK